MLKKIVDKQLRIYEYWSSCLQITFFDIRCTLKTFCGVKLLHYLYSTAIDLNEHTVYVTKSSIDLLQALSDCWSSDTKPIICNATQRDKEPRNLRRVISLLSPIRRVIGSPRGDAGLWILEYSVSGARSRSKTRLNEREKEGDWNGGAACRLPSDSVDIELANWIRSY